MTAVISECGNYRYELHRDLGSILRWHRPILWIMLNPSTADGTKDDPTIRRCVNFSKVWGYTKLMVGNLYALRSTNPKGLRAPPRGINAIGPLNDKHLASMASKAETVICAWGQPGPDSSRWKAVCEQLRHDRPLYAMGFTMHGQPRHPLMLPKETEFLEWYASESSAEGHER